MNRARQGRGAVRAVLCLTLMGAALLGHDNPRPPLAYATDSPSSALQQGEVTLRWLGNAGWEMQFEDTVILLDPWITRREIPRNQEWQSDEAAVLNVVAAADYIFVTHSHIDHVADVPFIARRFGSKVVGSATNTNLALTAGVDGSQLVTIQGGERLDFGSFSVEVVESLHDVLGSTPTAVRTIAAPLGRPIRGGDFAEGGSYLYYFTFGSQRVLDQGTGNFRIDRLAGLEPDLVLMVPNYDDYDLRTALTMLNPKWIVAHHWDAWREPYTQGITDRNQGRARRFRTDARAIIPQVGFTIPEYFQPLTLSGGLLREASAAPSVNAPTEQSPQITGLPERTQEERASAAESTPDLTSAAEPEPN